MNGIFGVYLILFYFSTTTLLFLPNNLGVEMLRELGENLLSALF